MDLRIDVTIEAKIISSPILWERDPGAPCVKDIPST